MENLIVCCLLYIVVIAIAYQPKPAASPVEIEETAAAKPTAKPVTVTLTQPSPAAYVAPKPVPTGDRRLEEMTIRQLYALAAAKGIKRYKSKSKATLILELST